MRSRYSAYLALVKAVGRFGPVGSGDIHILAGTGRDMDKCGTIGAFTTLLGIYNFKDKKEIDDLTEARYNEIISDLQKQYKDYLVNERENKLKEDFND